MLDVKSVTEYHHVESLKMEKKCNCTTTIISSLVLQYYIVRCNIQATERVSLPYAYDWVGIKYKWSCVHNHCT